MGDQVALDQLLFSVETDKATAPVNAPQAGVVAEIFVAVNDKVLVGAPLLKLGPAGASAPAPSAANANANASANAAPPSAAKSAPPPPGAAKKPAAAAPAPSAAPSAPAAAAPAATPTPAPKKPAAAPAAAASFSSGAREDRRERLSKMRRVIAQRLKDSQNTYAMLTTFQECDMSNLFALREKYGEAFAKKHGGIKLGFMSAFVKVNRNKKLMMTMFFFFFLFVFLKLYVGCCYCFARVA